MRAVVIDRFGGPEVLELREVPTPEPGPGQVRIAVHAAGTNPVDAQNRADGTWASISPPAILGSDFSGTVDALGEGVTGWALGEEVFGLAPFRESTTGTYADYHLAPASLLLRKPDRLSHVEAAAIPLAAGTAYTVLVKRLALRRGESVLIHGAGGGVGSFAVQIAAGIGARVIAAASERHHALLHELGAELCLDYGEVDVAAAARERLGAEIDAIADLVGGDVLARSLTVMREGGRAATIVALEGDLEPAIDRNHTLHGVLLDSADRATLEAVLGLVAAGEVRPVVSSVHPLEEAAAAHEELERGHVQGKIVLRIRWA
jgi:NADPH2:quinone reductase